jgi:hypothetical protein
MHCLWVVFLCPDRYGGRVRSKAVIGRQLHILLHLRKVYVGRKRVLPSIPHINLYVEWIQLYSSLFLSRYIYSLI